MTAEGASGYGSIALTFCLTFAVSFGYLYYKERAEEPKVAPLPPPRVSAHSSLRAPPLPPPAAPVTAPPVAPSSPTRPIIAAPNVGASSEPAEMAQPDPLPLLVRMRREAGRIEGNLKNRSEKPLSLTIVSRNRQGEETGQTMVMLAPFEMKNFGADEGMELHSGDHILIQSQGFKDREAVAP